jgi:nucleotide-binding universal stress UspA family protein
MVALDGSEKESRAIAVGLAIANLACASIHLVQILRAPTDRIAGQAELLGVDPAALVGRPDAEQRVGAIARRVSAEADRVTTWAVLESDDIARQLVDYAQARGVLAVVMGTRAARGVGLAVVGSVADRVMRESPRPVVLVPPGASYMEGKRVQLARALVPLDGSELAMRAVDCLMSISRAQTMELVLVEVVREADRRASSEQRLQVEAQRIRDNGGVAETCVIEGTDVPEGISRAVREVLVEMIAMSTRGAGGIRRLVLGSVAEGVVRSAEVPVLLLTPKMLEAAA